MVKNQTTIDKINRHLQLLHLESSGIQSEINKWITNNGSEWTVSRLKNIKTQLISTLAGKSFDKDWVAYNSKGVPKGPLGSIFKRCLREPKFRRRGIAVLNSYLAFISPSEKKEKDVYANIASPLDPSVDEFITENWSRFNITNSRQAIRIVKRKLHEDNIEINLSSGINTAKPFVTGEDQWEKSLKYTQFKLLPTEGIGRLKGYSTPGFNQELYGGELVSLYERGNKVRVIALPHAELQLFLSPLHNCVNDILSTFPEDCTFNQEKGAKSAQQWLKEGKTVHSVDLSAATDRFPLRFQMSVLRKLIQGDGVPNWASVFERSARLLWKSPFGDITYGAGQPMGLYGSFAIFALSHHALVQTLCRELNLERDPEKGYPYRILGDDIVIGDDLLNKEYRKMINHLGVKISESKTISSSSLAEFAGYVIEKKQTYKPPKPFKTGFTTSGLVNYIKALGKNPLKQGHPYYEVADLLTYLPEPFGAGVNPNGSSFLTRLNMYRDISDNDLSIIPIKTPHHKFLAERFSAPEFNPFTNREQVGGPRDYRLIDFVLDNLQNSIQRAEESLEPMFRFSEQLTRDVVQQYKLEDLYPLIYNGAQTVTSDFKEVFLEKDVKILKKNFPLYPWSG